MNLQPLGDRVVVKPMSEEDMKTPSGIIIPDSAQEKPQEGEVVAVGHGEPNDKGEKIKINKISIGRKGFSFSFVSFLIMIFSSDLEGGSPILPNKG